MNKSKDLEAARLLLDMLADKWAIPVLAAICEGGGKLRFNAILREVSAISQKSLTVCLKRLEMNGLVERHVMTMGELAVEYRVTPLGRTLDEPVAALIDWSEKFGNAVAEARHNFGEKVGASGDDVSSSMIRGSPAKLAG